MTERKEDLVPGRLYRVTEEFSLFHVSIGEASISRSDRLSQGMIVMFLDLVGSDICLLSSERIGFAFGVRANCLEEVPL